MTDKPRVTAKDFFLWLGAMVALYVSTTSFILLIHQYINFLLPSELERYANPYSGPIPFAISALVVMFPIFVWLLRMLHQDIRTNPVKKELWVRRWLVFITLFVAGLTLAIDLITLIMTFLEGEITSRFILKAATIFLVVGFGFWYFYQEIRGVWERKEGLSKTIAGAVGVILLVSIISGFFIIGSPMDQRLYKLDEQKISDLTQVQYQITNYWQQKQKLPVALSDLSDPLSGFVMPTDPETHEAYGYRTLSSRSFELCADFNLPTRTAGGEARPVYPGEENWQHEAGVVCFERTIDPDRYPPYTKTGF